jgi:hypothetical protein
MSLLLHDGAARPCLRVLFFRVGLGYIGEHEPTAALARLKALRACLLEESLRFRPGKVLAQVLPILLPRSLTSS